MAGGRAVLVRARPILGELHRVAGGDFDPIREAAQPGRDETADEERYLAHYYPRSGGKRNCIVGNALAAHFSFFSHAHFMYDSGILECYRALSRRVNREPVELGSLR